MERHQSRAEKSARYIGFIEDLHPFHCGVQLCFSMASVQSAMSCPFMRTRSSKRESRNPHARV